MLTLLLTLVLAAVVFGIGVALKIAFWGPIVVALLVAGVRGALGRRA